MLNILHIQNRGAALAACALLFAGVAMLDWVTGYEVSVASFYLLPVAVAALSFGRSGALMAALAATIIWRMADHYSGRDYSMAWIPYANALSRLIFFSVSGYLLAALTEARHIAEELSRTDRLTGAANSRRFFERLEEEISGQPPALGVALAYIDLDNFKQVNDSHGHEMGDKVLRAVFDAIQRNLRETDLGARLGGDEFALLLPDCSRETALQRMELVREEIEKEMKSQSLSVTASVGVVHFDRLPSSSTDIVSSADSLMYLVKKQGKNSVMAG